MAMQSCRVGRSIQSMRMVFMLSYANNGFVAFIVLYAGAADRRDREQCNA